MKDNMRLPISQWY